jgi:hypothetical protein
MSQHYSDPSRASDPHALPDVETFQARYGYCPECQSLVFSPTCTMGACAECNHRITKLDEHGWFYWFCLPGCLPDSEPFGPFPTEDEALADAQEGSE